MGAPQAAVLGSPKVRHMQLCAGHRALHDAFAAPADADACDWRTRARRNRRQMPLGVSSALGYLHLGQLARVKVPPHLLETGVHEDDGTPLLVCLLAAAWQ